MKGAKQRTWNRTLNRQDFDRISYENSTETVFQENQNSKEYKKMREIKNRVLNVILNNVFTERQRTIYKMNTCDGKTIQEISLELNLAQSTVRGALKKVKDKVEKISNELREV